IDILEPAERECLAGAWNRTAHPHRTETAIARFERIASENPQRTAISYGAQRVVYSELNERANGVAAALRAQHNVARGDCVAVMLPVNERLPETFLAIWKAGAHYLPIDPAEPKY